MTAAATRGTRRLAVVPCQLLGAAALHVAWASTRYSTESRMVQHSNNSADGTCTGQWVTQLYCSCWARLFCYTRPATYQYPTRGSFRPAVTRMAGYLQSSSSSSSSWCLLLAIERPTSHSLNSRRAKGMQKAAAVAVSCLYMPVIADHADGHHCC